MSVLSLRNLSYAAISVAALAVAACQGNVGTGSGLVPPPGSQQAPSAQGAAQSRTRTTAGAVFLAGGMNEIPLPAVAGFSLTLYMVEPSSAPSTAPNGGPRTRTERASSTPSPSPTPAPSASDKKSKAAPKATASPEGPKIDTKTTIYPDSVPAAPTPEPTGNVQTYAEREAVVRGYVLPQTDVKLYSLAAARFKIPAAEHPEGRDFTIALFESRKHKKWKLIAYNPEATLDGDIVSADSAAGPITLKKKTGYAFILYGDDLAPTPGPAGTYPPPGSNPFNTPNPAGTMRPFGPPTPFTPQTPPWVGPH